MGQSAPPSEAALATRREVLDQASAAARAGDHLRAIELAERAARISMALSVRMFLAEEHAAIDDHAAAYGAASACLSDAARDTSTANRSAIADRCRLIAANARRHLIALTVLPPTPTPAGFTVRVNGQLVPDELLGLPYFVNPGRIAVDASAPGYVSFRWDGGGVPGAPQEVRAVLDREPATPVAVVARPQAPQPPSPPVQRPERRVEAPRGVPLSALVLFGVGGALTLATIPFGALYAVAPQGCNRAGEGNMDLVCATPAAAGRAEMMGAWVALGWTSGALGVASLAVGLGLAVTNRGPAERSTALRVAPRVSPTEAGASMGWCF